MYIHIHTYTLHYTLLSYNYHSFVFHSAVYCARLEVQAPVQASLRQLASDSSNKQ